MTQRNYSPDEVAQIVSDDCHNTQMRSWVKLYVEVIQRSGFRFVRGKSMTFGEFCARASTVEDASQRAGQWAFNVLHSMRPDLSDQVRSVSGLDPFYQDVNLPRFYTFVAESWDK